MFKPMLSRRHALTALAAVALTAGSLTTAAPAAAETLTKASLRLKWLPQAQFAGFYVALAKGYYKAEGIDLAINPGGPNLLTENLVATDGDTFGLSGGTDSVFAARDKGLPVVCIESRQAYQALKSLATHKTDRNDARGLAHLARTGFFKPVHVKSLPAHAVRSLISARKKLVGQRVTLENQIRGLAVVFGVRLPRALTAAFIDNALRASEGIAGLSAAMRGLIAARTAVMTAVAAIDADMRHMTRASAACRRLMTIPGVGQLTALAFVAAIDDPSRIRRSRDIGAYFGLVPRRHQSGEVDYVGSISKCGDRRLRTLLYEAANVMLTRYKPPLKLKDWALAIAKRSTMRKARIALARRLAIIMHAMLRHGTEFKAA